MVFKHCVKSDKLIHQMVHQLTHHLMSELPHAGCTYNQSTYVLVPRWSSKLYYFWLVYQYIQFNSYSNHVDALFESLHTRTPQCKGLQLQAGRVTSSNSAAQDLLVYTSIAGNGTQLLGIPNKHLYACGWYTVWN